MAARSNALSEITRFWLQECHGLLLRESVPVKLKHNNSDIDFVASSPKGHITILNRITFKNAIIETKDERDFDPRGTNFALRVKEDYDKLQKGGGVIDEEVRCHFSMLKRQHHGVAEKIFSDADFSKIFIFHNIKSVDLEKEEIIDYLQKQNIHIVTSSEVLSDIRSFLKKFRTGAGIRNSLVGDMLDMLVTYHKWGPQKD